MLNKYPAEELVSHMKIDTGQDRKIIHVISAIRVLKPVASMVEQELHPFEHIDD